MSRNAASSPGMKSRTTMLIVSWPSEFHCRSNVELRALGLADVEEFTLGEAAAAGDHRGGELLDRRVVVADGGIVEAARGGDLVLDRGELALELDEVLAGLEVRIGFGESKHLAERAGESVFRRPHRRRPVRGRR